MFLHILKIFTTFFEHFFLRFLLFLECFYIYATHSLATMDRPTAAMETSFAASAINFSVTTHLRQTNIDFE